MRARTRRRLDVALLGVGAGAAGLAAVLGGILGDSERISQMWVGASLDAGGGAAITEVIDYDFGLALDKHGLLRQIPGLPVDAPVQVSSASAPAGIASRSTVFVDGEPALELRIGDPNQTVTGRHRYRLAYRLGTLQDGATFRWDAVGTAWQHPVGLAEIHVVAPWRFNSPTCSTGAVGATGGCSVTEPEPGHLRVVVRDIDPGEGVTITGVRAQPLAAAPALPSPPLSVPPDPGAGLALPAAVAAVAGLGAAATTSRLVRQAGRERIGVGGPTDAAWASDGTTSTRLVDHEELADMATTEFAPPAGVTAAQGGVVLTESIGQEHKVAWLVERAIAGSVELLEEGKAVTLVRTDSATAPLDGPLRTMFGGRDRITLGKYDPTFASGWAAVGTELQGWHDRSGLWDAAGDRNKVVARVVGGLALALGAVGTAGAAALAARSGEGWLPLVALGGAVAVAGWALLIRSWELRRRTPEGSALWLRIESFRRFLEHSEAHHAEEAAQRGVLREYTAWALALGEIDRWSRAVEASGTAIADQAGLAYVHMAPALSSSTHHASTAPSSSGGGGGGGGSVGGGGGGGGGGSW